MEQRLGLTEYTEVLLDNISKVVINRSYIEQNQRFFDKIVFKLFEQYYYSLEFVSIRKQAEELEIVFSCVFEFKPPVEKPEDIITL